MRRTAFLIVLVILFSFFSLSFTSAAEYAPEFEVRSESAYLINAQTGAVIYSKNADQKISPSSLTQLMTAVVAVEEVENIDTTEATYQFTMQDYLYNQRQSGVSVSLGGILLNETFTIRQLIYAMFLQSANDAALMIADAIGNGSQEAFVELMNQKAQELGLTNTHFTNPTGFYDSEQYTTAADMIKLAQYALTLPGFEDYISATRYVVESTNQQTNLTWISNNSMMLSSSEYYYAPVKGIKPAASDESGRCFLSTASRDGFTYMLIVMNAPYKDDSGNYYEENYAFTDTRNIYSWAFENFQVKDIIEAGQMVTEIKVKLAWGIDNVKLMAKDSFSALIPAAADVNNDIKLEPVLDEFVKAPIARGDEIGYARVMLANEEIGRITLVASDNISRNWFLAVIDFIQSIFSSFVFKFIFVLILLLIIFYIIIMILRNRRKRRYRSYKRYKTNRRY